MSWASGFTMKLWKFLCVIWRQKIRLSTNIAYTLKINTAEVTKFCVIFVPSEHGIRGCFSTLASTENKWMVRNNSFQCINSKYKNTSKWEAPCQKHQFSLLPIWLGTTFEGKHCMNMNDKQGMKMVLEGGVGNECKWCQIRATNRFILLLGYNGDG